MAKDNELNDQMQVRRDKVEMLKENGYQPYASADAFKPEQHFQDLQEQYKDDDKEALEGKHINVKVAGRLMSKRGKGKVGFGDLQDATGRLQLYIRRDEVGEDDYRAIWKKADLGDIIGIEGEIMRTDMGELSVRADRIVHLTKSLRPLPKDHFGIKDQEIIYRERQLDLIMNRDSYDVFVKRSKIITAVREYLNSNGYLEVETPVLHNLAGGASARPFITHHNALDMDLYLRIALELHLKRLVVGGMERVYEIGRVFRNEGIDHTHNPEFTELEVYTAYYTMHDVMDLVQNMFQYVADKVNDGNRTLTYGDKEIHLDGEWPRIHMVDAIKEQTGVDFWPEMTDEEARALAKEHNVPVEATDTYGHVVNNFFEEFVEDTLEQPTFIYGHPKAISPLARGNEEDPRFTDRFEFFVAGHEYGNAFTELSDPIDQRERFEAQMEEKANGNDEAQPLDEEFLRALEVGMPPTGGLGIGIDRMVMLFTDRQSIRDVLLFPTMRNK